ncbi:MAG: DUF1553 domain-containing protein, partial [Bacteroidota bacterium]
IDEEFRLEYVFDRSETLATAFMGLTLECARCHDHKFDPISQEEYFQTAAFFNNVKELGMTGDDGNFGPMLMLPDSVTKAKLAELETQIAAAEQELQLTEGELLATKKFITELPDDYEPKGLAAHFPLDKMTKDPNDDRWSSYIFDNNANLLTRGEPELVEGKFGKGVKLTGEYDDLFAEKTGLYEAFETYSGGAWINTTKREPKKSQFILGNSGDKNNGWRGWDFSLDTLNRLSLRLVSLLPHNYLRVTSNDSIQINEWTHIFFTYDGTANADAVKLYVNGKELETFSPFDRLYKTTYPAAWNTYLPEDRALRIGRAYGSFGIDDGIFKGVMDDIRVYDRALIPEEVARLANAPENNKDQPDRVQKMKAREAVAYQKQAKKVNELRRDYWATRNDIPEIMVMEEMPTTRPMYLYNRGEYSQPTYEVGLGTPASVGEFPDDLPQNRIGLSQWLFRPDHPLTARVAVNRYWQQLFGVGIVKTPHDFGVQGALPTHPKLLDWLAIQYQQSNWDTKAILKMMVMSATYQQSSKTTEDQLRIDPENTYLARGASYRLTAEMIRDNALHASGLLVSQIGGESVRPYQPEGLWIEKGNFSHKLLRYKETRGDSLYRRSLYTFVKRTSPHPMMTAFDAPSRDNCSVQRESTNTPLQALILLNDPQFVEASRVLAERVQKEGGEDVAERMAYAFRLSTGRRPNDQEVKLLEDLFKKQMTHFEEDPKEALALLEVGDYERDKALDVKETAAYAVVANTLLNHDEAYTKR